MKMQFMYICHGRRIGYEFKRFDVIMASHSLGGIIYRTPLPHLQSILVLATFTFIGSSVS